MTDKYKDDQDEDRNGNGSGKRSGVFSTPQREIRIESLPRCGSLDSDYNSDVARRQQLKEWKEQQFALPNNHRPPPQRFSSVEADTGASIDSDAFSDVGARTRTEAASLTLIQHQLDTIGSSTSTSRNWRESR